MCTYDKLSLKIIYIIQGASDKPPSLFLEYTVRAEFTP